MTRQWSTLLAITLLIAANNVHMLFAKTAAKLIVDPPRGFYEQAFDATITSPVDGATIKYTFDGTDPMTSPTAKSAPSPAVVNINPTNTKDHDKAPGVCLRAIAVLADTAASNLGTHTYLFVNHITDLSPDRLRPGPGWPYQGTGPNDQKMDYGMDRDVWNDPAYRNKIIPAMLDIPSMSMVMDLDDLFDPATGIYVNAAQHGMEWERPCSLELLNPDGSDGFHINCGVRIRGGYSRVPRNPKHAFRYFFRSDYGEAKLRHPLFEDEGADEFDNIDLRTAQNYSWSYGAGSDFGGAERNTFLRDVFSRDLQRDMGEPYTRSRYYHLYINGTYWGLFQTQERSEASFADTYFGGSRDDWDAIKVDAGFGRPYIMEATDGNLDAYNLLWDECQGDLRDMSLYYRLQGLNPDGSRNPDFPKLLDLDNLIDYMINSMFVGDFDAPVSNFINNQRPNNFWALFNRVDPGGMIWFRHDAEHTLFDLYEDRTGPYPAGNQREHSNPQYIHQRLTANPEYRIRFADRVYKHFFNDGALTPEANIERLMTRKEEIDLAIIAESARWGDALRGEPYTRNKEWMNEVDYLVDDYFPERTDIVLDQFVAQGWYPAFQPPEFNQPGGKVEKGFQAKLSAQSGDIYYTLNGSSPNNPLAAGGFRTLTLLPWSASKRALVPLTNLSSNWRRSTSFDDSDWDLCSGAPGGVGYERGDGYQSWITLDVGGFMRKDETSNPNPSCLIRIPFTITQEQLENLSSLSLQLRYDDGFVAYLNGDKIVEVNAPDDLGWNSFATQNHEAESIESFDLTPHIGTLKSGDNLLAIHGLNVSLTSSDFLVMAELTGGIVEESGDLVGADAIKYSAPITINKTTHIKARVLKGGQWSALNEATFAVDEDLSTLRLTELHYHPLPEIVGGDTLDGDLFEFLEMKNLGAADINLTGAAWIKGVKFDFPAGTAVRPGGFYLLCSSAEHFKMRYGFDADGEYVGNLSNGGERIVMVDALGDTVFNVKYNDKAPWPVEPDSTGQSLVSKLARPHGDPADPAYWTTSANIHGSPNADDAASPVQLKVSATPDEFSLQQNYPNPFNPVTTICFETPRDGEVDIAIFNTLGQRIETLAAEKLPAGRHAVVWNAAHYAGGIYFCRMQTGDFRQTIKLLLIK